MEIKLCLMLFLCHPSHKRVFVKNIHIVVFGASYIFVSLYPYLIVYN